MLSRILLLIYLAIFLNFSAAYGNTGVCTNEPPYYQWLPKIPGPAGFIVQTLAYNPSQFLKSENPKENTEFIPNKNHRSVTELRQYFKCYRRQNERGCSYYLDYLDKYEGQIGRAAKAFEIPFAVLACLLFVESSQWEIIESHAGGVGIAQLTRMGIAEVDQILDNDYEFQKAYRSMIFYLLNSIQRCEAVP